MDYNAAKAAVDKLKREITLKKRDLKKTEKEIAQNAAEMSNATKSYETQLADAKSAAYKSFVEAKIAPVEEKIKKLEGTKETLSSNYEQACKKVDKTQIREKLLQGSVSTEEVRELVDSIQEQSSTILGEHLFSKVSENAEAIEMQVNSDQLESYTSYFHKAKKQMSKLALLNKLSILDKANNFIVGIPIDSKLGSNKTALLGIGTVTVLIYLFLFKYLMLINGVLMLLVTTLNIYRSAIICNVIQLSKSISTQLDDIDSSIDALADKEYNNKIKDLEHSYNERVNKIDGKIDELKAASERITLEANTDFQFDDSQNKEVFNTVIGSYKSKDRDLAQTKGRIENEISELSIRYNQALEMMNTIVGDLRDEYLNFDTVGEERIFHTRFLLDIQDDSPVFFDHEMCSYLFLYDFDDDMVNFLRLVLIQLRIKLNPFNLNMVLIDTLMSGNGFLNFRSSDNPTFNVLYKEDDISEFTDSITNTMMTRLEMSKNVEDFNKYNETLIADDSIPEAYYFVFIRDPDNRILNDTLIKRMCLLGGKAGIFVHIFYNEEKFAKLKETGEEVLENMDKICLLREGKLMSRAKTFIRENVLQMNK